MTHLSGAKQQGELTIVQNPLGYILEFNCSIPPAVWLDGCSRTKLQVPEGPNESSRAVFFWLRNSFLFEHMLWSFDFGFLWLEFWLTRVDFGMEILWYKGRYQLFFFCSMVWKHRRQWCESNFTFCTPVISAVAY